jgi:hypothetical protein
LLGDLAHAKPRSREVPVIIDDSFDSLPEARSAEIDQQTERQFQEPKAVQNLLGINGQEVPNHISSRLGGFA